MVRALILSLSALFLSACGGGDSSTSSNPTDPNQLFSLAALKYNSDSTGAANQAYTTQLVGTATTLTTTYSASGSYALNWQNRTLYSGVMANPQEHNSFISYFISGGALGQSVHYRLYLNASNALPLGLNRPDTSVNCLVTSSFALPDTAKIGDNGLYFTDACNDTANTTDEVTWAIADALGGNVYVVLTISNRDASNVLQERVIMRIKIDGAGNVAGFQLNAALQNLGIDVSNPAL